LGAGGNLEVSASGDHFEKGEAMTDAGFYIRSEKYDGKKEIVPGTTFYASELEQTTLADAEFVQVPWTLWGDYVGGTTERSNCRAIWEDYKDILVKGEFGWGSEVLLFPFIEFDEESFDLYEAFSEAMDELEESYIYDEDDWGQLKDELMMAAIDDYLLDDLARDFPGTDKETLRGIVDKYLQEVGSVEHETATGSVVFHGIEKFVGEYLEGGSR
jgi:hypothetical protein